MSMKCCTKTIELKTSIVIPNDGSSDIYHYFQCNVCGKVYDIEEDAFDLYQLQDLLDVEEKK